MKLQVLDKDEKTVLHEIDTIDRRDMGAVYSLALMLFCISPQYRDAMISYIVSRGDLDVDEMARIAGCMASTIRSRLKIARRVFQEAVRDFGGAFPVRDDMAVSVPVDAPDDGEDVAASRDVPRKTGDGEI